MNFEPSPSPIKVRVTDPIACVVSWIRRIEVHEGVFRIVAFDAFSPVQVFDYDSSQSFMDWSETLFQVFERAYQAISVCAISHAGLEAWIDGVSAPASHDL